MGVRSISGVEEGSLRKEAGCVEREIREVV